MQGQTIKFVKYNKPNVHAFGSKDGKTIHYLKPGWNEFPSAVIDEHVDHPQFKKMIEDKVIEIHAEKVKETPKAKAKDLIEDGEVQLKNLSEKEAIEVVGATHNRALLQRWLDEENRSKVKRALEKQIKPLLPDAKEE